VAHEASQAFETKVTFSLSASVRVPFSNGNLSLGRAIICGSIIGFGTTKG
jgi:hypothetical protein